MNILALLKGDERDARIVEMTNQISKEGDKVHLLHVVQVNGEIPLQKSGEVLDFCSEFDLSEYQKESDNALSEIKQNIIVHQNSEAHSLIGDALSIVLSFIDKFEIDFVISGAHVTSHYEDTVSETFAAHLIRTLKIPYLTVNSEGVVPTISSITIVNQYENDHSTEFVEELQDRTKSSLRSVHFTNEKLEEELKSLITDGNIHLIAFTEKHYLGVREWFRKDNRINLVNHIDFPILIF